MEYTEVISKMNVYTSLKRRRFAASGLNHV